MGAFFCFHTNACPLILLIGGAGQCLHQRQVKIHHGLQRICAETNLLFPVEHITNSRGNAEQHIPGIGICRECHRGKTRDLTGIHQFTCAVLICKIAAIRQLINFKQIVIRAIRLRPRDLNISGFLLLQCQDTIFGQRSIRPQIRTNIQRGNRHHTGQHQREQYHFDQYPLDPFDPFGHRCLHSTFWTIHTICYIITTLSADCKKSFFDIM